MAVANYDAVIKAATTMVAKGYGCTFNPPIMAHHAELKLFQMGLSQERGGLGKYGHLRKVCRFYWPEVQWNDWLEEQMLSLCDERGCVTIGTGATAMRQKRVVWAGCKTAGKTFGAALYAFAWWLCAPNDSLVILTSTTAKAVRTRIWSVIRFLVGLIEQKYGKPAFRVIDSKTMIQYQKGDDKHAIFALPVGKGETAKAAANIQGMHATRVMLVMDEATEIEPAILLAKENLKAGCSEYIELYIGNAKSRFDSLGQAMEPKNGWNSVSVEDEEWETKDNGICLHFDGYKSPNVVARKTEHPKIYKYEDYLIAINSGKQNEVKHWMYERGFPPPDGVVNTVLSESLLIKHDAFGKHTFLSNKRLLAALDPAFGGDRCILQFAEFGDLQDGRMAIQLTETIEIPINATDSTPADYQVANRVIVECKMRGVSPSDFAMDATGTGRGVFAIIFTDWSSSILRVEFGGAPTEIPVGSEDMRPACDVYDRRVTEIWFSVREMVESDLLKGMTREMAVEFGGRLFDIKGRKISIETKEDFKERFHHSPDVADAVATLICLAKDKGARGGSRGQMSAERQWLTAQQKINRVYDETESQANDENDVGDENEWFNEQEQFESVI